MRKLFFFCILFVLALGSAIAASPLTIDTLRKTESLLPHADWLADPDKQYNIENITSGHIQSRFISLGKGFPLYAKGPVWIRFSLSKSQNTPYTESNRISFNLGQLPAGTTTSYVYSGATSLLTHNQWHSETIQNDENVLLPIPGASPMQIFVHFEEAPGLWFHPTVTPQKLIKPKALPFAYILPGLLILSILMCFLRGIREKNATLFWSCFLLGLGLIMFFSPTPALSKPVQFIDSPLFLAPGLALLLIPHIGRMLLHTPTKAPLQDGLLASYSLIGVGLALAPFFPGLNWLTRLTPLWGVLLIPLIPLCLWALARRTEGALAFSGICFMPAIGSLIALSTLGSPTPPALAPFAVNWGLAVGGIGLAFANFKKIQKDSKKEQQTTDKESKELYARQSMFSEQPVQEKKTPPQTLKLMPPTPPKKAAPIQEAQQEQPKEKIPFEYPPITEEQLVQPSSSPQKNEEKPATAFKQESPAPSLQSVTQPTMSPVQEKSVASEVIVATPAKEPVIPQPKAVQPTPASASESSTDLLTPTEPSAVEIEKSAFEYPTLEEIMAAEKYPPQQAPQPKVISLVDDSLDQFDYEQFKEQIPLPLPGMPLSRKEQTTFTLNTLLKEVHALIAPLAQRKNLLFSWYAAPSLPTTLTGDEQRLRQTLLLLLHNAVEATTQGAVQLSVRPVSADDPYHLLFSINDSGSTQRTDVGYFHAWELASRTDGTFSVKYSPTHGPLVTFSVRFTAPSTPSAASPKNERSASSLEPLVLGAPTEPAPDQPHVVTGSTQTANQELQVTALPLTQTDADETSRYTAFVNEFTQADALQPAAPELQTAAHGKVFANIVLGDMTTSNRRLISYYLQELPVQIINTSHVETSFANLTKQTNNLFIFDGDSPETETITSLNAIQQAKTLQSIPDAKTLVLTGHKKQAKRMLQNGCDYTLQKPFSEEALIQTVITALPVLIHVQDNITLQLKQGKNQTERSSSSHTKIVPAEAPPAGQTIHQLEQPAPFENEVPGSASAPVSTEVPPPHPASGEVGTDTATKVEQKLHHTVSVHHLSKQPSSGLQDIQTTNMISLGKEQYQPNIVTVPSPNQQFTNIRASDVHAPLSTRTPLLSQHENTVTTPLRTPAHNKPSLIKPLTVIGDNIHINEPTQPKHSALEDKTNRSAKQQEKETLPPSEIKTIFTTNTIVASPIAKEKQKITIQASNSTAIANEKKQMSSLTDYIITDPVPQKSIVESKNQPNADMPTMEKAPDTQPLPATGAEQPPAVPAVNPQQVSVASQNSESQSNNVPEVLPVQITGPTVIQNKARVPGMPLLDMDNETIELSLVPLIPGLIDDLKETLLEISGSIDNGQLLLTQEATGRLAGKAEAFNLTKLGKLARCVERAAEANDLEAVQTLHDDLVLMTQKYIGSLQQSYSTFNR